MLRSSPFFREDCISNKESAGPQIKTNTSQGFDRVHCGALLTSDRWTEESTERTGLRNSTPVSSWQFATQAIPTWDSFPSVPELASEDQTSAFPGWQRFFTFKIVAYTISEELPPSAAGTGQQSSMNHDSRPKSESRFGSTGQDPLERLQRPLASAMENFAPLEAALTGLMHPVRSQRRRGFHEKRNADQRHSARRKPNRHC